MRFFKSIFLFFLITFLSINYTYATISYQEEFFCDVTALYEVNINEMYDLILESGQLGSIKLKAIQRYTHSKELEIDEYTKWWLDEYPDTLSFAINNRDVGVTKKDKESEELYLKITRTGIISILNALGAGLNNVKYISSLDFYELNLESFLKKWNSTRSQSQNYYATRHLITVHVYDSHKGFVSYYIRFETKGPVPVGVRDGEREPVVNSKVN